MNRKSFSEREGITSPPEVIQLDSISDELRNGLWNLIRFQLITDYRIISGEASSIIEEIYHHVLRRSIDDLPSMASHKTNRLREYFFSSSIPWYQIYDIVDFLVSRNDFKFRSAVNDLLEKENSGYRFIEKILVPISSLAEISSIEDTLNLSNKHKFSGANEHMKTALVLLSDRHNPDYRNSIKESISMLESLITLLGHKRGFTPALEDINKSLELHPALIRGISNLYGYTSDEDGIRHSILEQTDISYADAKFMLVACSALFNFLVQKSDKAGLL